ncbi:ATP-binding cassette domain-containing protein [Streptomyces sp. NPDC001774]
MAIEADGISACGRAGMVFMAVDASIGASQLAVITGPPRSGRTSLLLALAGRFRLAAGTVYIPGTVASRPARELRRRISVARACPAIGLDERLQIEELISERRAVAGRGVTVQNVWDACALLGLDIPPARTLLGDLSAADSLLMCLALSLSENRDGLIIDDIDLGLSSADIQRVWEALRTVTAAGRTVIATAVQDHGADVTISLERPHRIPPHRSRRITGKSTKSATTAESVGGGNAPSKTTAGPAGRPGSTIPGNSEDTDDRAVAPTPPASTTPGRDGGTTPSPDPDTHADGSLATESIPAASPESSPTQEGNHSSPSDAGQSATAGRHRRISGRTTDSESAPGSGRSPGTGTSADDSSIAFSTSPSSTDSAPAGPDGPRSNADGTITADPPPPCFPTSSVTPAPDSPDAADSQNTRPGQEEDTA